MNYDFIGVKGQYDIEQTITDTSNNLISVIYNTSNNIDNNIRILNNGLWLVNVLINSKFNNTILYSSNEIQFISYGVNSCNYLTKIDNTGLNVYHPYDITLPTASAGWWNVNTKLTDRERDCIGLRTDVINLQANDSIISGQIATINTTLSATTTTANSALATATTALAQSTTNATQISTINSILPTLFSSNDIQRYSTWDFTSNLIYCNISQTSNYITTNIFFSSNYTLRTSNDLQRYTISPFSSNYTFVLNSQTSNDLQRYTLSPFSSNYTAVLNNFTSNYIFVLNNFSSNYTARTSNDLQRYTISPFSSNYTAVLNTFTSNYIFVLNNFSSNYTARTSNDLQRYTISPFSSNYTLTLNNFMSNYVGNLNNTIFNIGSNYYSNINIFTSNTYFNNPTHFNDYAYLYQGFGSFQQSAFNNNVVFFSPSLFNLCLYDATLNFFYFGSDIQVQNNIKEGVYNLSDKYGVWNSNFVDNKYGFLLNPIVNFNSSITILNQNYLRFSPLNGVSLSNVEAGLINAGANMAVVFGGDLILSSFWGTQINLNHGGITPVGNAPNTKIPNTSTFTITSRPIGNTNRTNPNIIFSVDGVSSNVRIWGGTTSIFGSGVGIGTNTPLSLLDVRGTTFTQLLQVVDATTYTNQYQLLLNPPTSTQGGRIQTIQQGVGFNQNLFLQGSGGAVGIATNSTIQGSFDVGGSATGILYSFLNGLRISGRDTGNTLWQSTGDIGISVNTGNNIKFAIGNGNERMRINASGNVGIGTTSPNEILDVNGGPSLFRNGISPNSFQKNQLAFSFNNTTQYKHVINTSHNSGGTGNGFDFLVWNYLWNTDANQYGSNLILSVADTGILCYKSINIYNGNIFIFTTGAPYWTIYNGTAFNGATNSLIFYHYGVGMSSSWWFNGTQTSTNAEISDERIKKEIKDIDEPLNKLLKISPKEYYLCDEKDYNKKYGLVAQDIEKEYPNLVYNDTEYIANIYKEGIYDNKIITLDIVITDLINIEDELKLLLDNNDKNNLEIAIDDTPYNNRYKRRFVKVVRIIDEYSFEVDKEIKLNENDNKVFVYGKKVNDFKKLDYESLYCLHIGATKELYNIIQKQQEQINYLMNKEK